MKNALLVSVGVGVLLVAFSASAGDPPTNDDHKRAAQSFREAQSSFERNDYAAAAAAFEQAAQLEPHPAPLLDAAEAWTRSGDLVRAAQDCDRVLAMQPLEDRYRAEAERRLSKLADKVGTLDLRGPHTLSVQIDGGPGFNLPARRRVAPGSHALLIVDLASERRRVESVDVVAGARVDRDIDPLGPSAPEEASPGVQPPALAPRPPVAVAPRAHTESPHAVDMHAGGSEFPAAAWATAGVGAAAVAATITFGLMTVASRTDFYANPTVATESAFYRNRALTNVSLGVAAASVIATVVLWRTARSRPTIAVYARPDGAHVVGQISLDP